MHLPEKSTPTSAPASQPVEIKPTDEVVSGLMTDIEKARAARAWKPLSQALEELEKDKTEEGG